MKENVILPPHTLIDFLKACSLTDAVTATFVRFGEEIWVAREKELNPSTFVQELINYISEGKHPARYAHNNVSDLGLVHIQGQIVALLGGDDRYETKHHSPERAKTYELAQEQIAHFYQEAPTVLSQFYFALDYTTWPGLEPEPETE